MKHKKPLILLILSCCLAQPVVGQTLFGNFDCGQWINNQNSMRKAWLLGYMSGLSSGTNPDGKKKDWLGKVDSADQIYLFVENYCRANPLKRIEAAGLTLYVELLTK